MFHHSVPADKPLTVENPVDSPVSGRGQKMPRPVSPRIINCFPDPERDRIGGFLQRIARIRRDPPDVSDRTCLLEIHNDRAKPLSALPGYGQSRLRKQVDREFQPVPHPPADPIPDFLSVPAYSFFCLHFSSPQVPDYARSPAR